MTLACVTAPLRGVPWFWVPVDAAFGVFGAVPLGIAWMDVNSIDGRTRRAAGHGDGQGHGHDTSDKDIG